MQDHFEVRNEFAWVRLERAEDGNAARLRITDVRSGRSVMMDALELAMLTFCRHADFAWYVNPARWWNQDRDEVTWLHASTGVSSNGNGDHDHEAGTTLVINAGDNGRTDKGTGS